MARQSSIDESLHAITFTLRDKDDNEMKDRLRAVVATMLVLAAFNAGAATITFNELAAGTTLSTQYAGVVFSANAFTGPGSPGGTWATNTNMTVVSATGSDVGDLGLPNLVGGNVLRSFAGWTNENGDPSFRIGFTSAIDSFSVDFAGVDTPGDVRLFAYDGSNLLGTVVGSTMGQFTLSFAAARMTSVSLTPGDFLDYVAVDNIRYQTVPAVPEPGTWALMGLGIVLVGRWSHRHKR